jgi:hypothetical protein
MVDFSNFMNVKNKWVDCIRVISNRLTHKKLMNNRKPHWINENVEHWEVATLDLVHERETLKHINNRYFAKWTKK